MKINSKITNYFGIVGVTLLPTRCLQIDANDILEVWWRHFTSYTTKNSTFISWKSNPLYYEGNKPLILPFLSEITSRNNSGTLAAMISKNVKQLRRTVRTLCHTLATLFSRWSECMRTVLTGVLWSTVFVCVHDDGALLKTIRIHTEQRENSSVKARMR